MLRRSWWWRSNGSNPQLQVNSHQLFVTTYNLTNQRSLGNGLNNELTTWIGELECTETDVIESFIVKNHTLVGVLHELVDGESGVVGLNNGIGDLR